MPTKALLSVALLFASAQSQALAKAYFQPKEEMIEKAEAIAVIELGDVREGDTQGRTWTYRAEGTARTETVLKGELPPLFTLHGAETFICAQCPIAAGRYVAFLKRDGGLWTGSNWHYSLRPIRDGEVEWFAAAEPHTLRPAPLATVLQEIQTHLPPTPGP